MDLYERLSQACASGSRDAVLLLGGEFGPVEPGARVMPPTYPDGDRAPDGAPTRYVLERRRLDGQPEPVLTVGLDSRQSQANRVEEALLELRRAGRLAYPLLEVHCVIDADRSLVVSSLEAPHRYADAYLRDSEIEGVPFDQTELGRALQLANPSDVRALYRWSPESLLLGSWNAHRKGRQARFPHLYGSEVFGLEPVVGSRRAGRMDPANLTGAAIATGDGDWSYAVPVEGTKKQRGEKLSERGLGNITPGISHGGVSISGARRMGSLSLQGLRRLHFGDASQEASDAARVALAALALVGDRAAFAGPSLWLRAGCDLVLLEDRVGFVRRGGEIDRVEVGVEEALAVFEQARKAAAAVGVVMDTATVTLAPRPNLAEAIRYSYLRAADGEVEGGNR